MTAVPRVAEHSPEIGVIIPTFQRPEALRATLAGLAGQDLSGEAIEVVVVDDGSLPPVDLVASEWPFRLETVRLEREGAAAARNAGAARCRAGILVFVDDDVSVVLGALRRITDAVRRAGDAVVLGDLHEDIGADRAMPRSKGDTPDAGHGGQPQALTDAATALEPVHFTRCMTGFLAIRHDLFDRLGGFQDPTGGWPSWDDVDFGYRAHREGLPILRAPAAHAIHRDAAQASFELARDRWWRAAHSAVALFERHPELLRELPMFHDKVPIAWGRDSLRLILRKLLRHVASQRTMLRALTALRAKLRNTRAPRAWVAGLERQIVRGAMADGYRSGIRDRERSLALTP